MMDQIMIVAFEDLKHRSDVVQLWIKVFGYETAHNEPNLVIDNKVDVDDGLFFIALIDEHVVGTVMAGYDGHRGWIYSLAVDPELRKSGYGSALLREAESQLSARGCLKVNLQIMKGNDAVQGFYLANEYAVANRVSMGKRLTISEDR
jgi:ribosomal protein S18 acetylase RimI-like enzyme